MTEKDKKFTKMVAYFWIEKGDPTRYCDWNDDRCRQLMPAFHAAWSQYRAYRTLTHLAAQPFDEG